MKFKVGDRVKVHATYDEFKNMSIGYTKDIERLKHENSEIKKIIPNAKSGDGGYVDAYLLDCGFVIHEQYLIPS